MEGQEKKYLIPQDYGWPKKFQINVNMLYKMQSFISYDEFKILYNQQLEGEPAESSFLKLKYDVASNYGPINSKQVVTTKAGP